MLITDKSILKNYAYSKGIWLGIPGIEITKGGRTFITFFSGGTTDGETGNYVVLTMSEDGKNFPEPIAVCFEAGCRCIDPSLWIDPLGRLWLTWTKGLPYALYGAICENPDSDEVVFGEEFYIGDGVKVNKPAVLSTGEWLFPIAVWPNNMSAPPCSIPDEQIGVFVYVSYDNGKSFKKLGKTDVKAKERSVYEPMLVELNDGKVRCFMRKKCGIAAADSYDYGLHWGEGYEINFGGRPCTRFHIRRLESGRILLVYHYDTNQRTNLTAMLSEDEGETFPYRLLLDERNAVSYPDVAIDSDGMINVIYDRERGISKTCLAEALSCAREILTARISEEDIIKGYLVNKKSYLKNVVIKLTDYNGEVKNPYNEENLFSDFDYAKHLSDTIDNVEIIVSKIMDVYRISCSNIHNVEAEKLDSLIGEYREKRDSYTLAQIISLIRNAETKTLYDEKNLVDKICKYIVQNMDSVFSSEDIAKEFHFSASYIRHIFKKGTGTSIINFKRAHQLKEAKILLKATKCKITDVALTCGFENSSYFTEMFTKEVGVTPSDFRNDSNAG